MEAKVEMRCPTCKKLVKRYIAVYFTEDFNVFFEGKCCGAILVSPEMPILSFIPTDKKKKGN